MKKTLALLPLIAVVMTAMPAAEAATASKAKSKTPAAKAAGETTLKEYSKPSAKSVAEGIRDRETGKIALRDEIFIKVEKAMKVMTLKDARALAAKAGATVVGGKEMLGIYQIRWKKAVDMQAMAAKLNEMKDADVGISFITSFAYGAKPVEAPAACLIGNMHPQIGGQTLEMGPLFRLEIAQSAITGKNTETMASALCRETDSGKKPVAADHVVFYADPLDTRQIMKDFCATVTTAGWRKEMCDIKAAMEKGSSFPEEVVIFPKGKYPKLQYNGLEDQGYDSTFAHYEQKMAEGKGTVKNDGENHPKLMSFPQHDNLLEYIWVTDDKSWTTPDGHPYAVSCLGGALVPKAFVYTDPANCWASYSVSDTLAVKYRINVPLDKLSTQARLIDAHVREMVKDWTAAAALAEEKTPAEKSSAEKSSDEKKSAPDSAPKK